MQKLLRKHSRKIWEFIVIALATILLIYQVSLNVGVYLSKPTIFEVSLEPVKVFQLPPVSVCPHPPFRPDILRDLGVDVSGHYMEVEENLSVLKGIPEDMETVRLWDDASWHLGQVVKKVSVGGESIYYNSSLTISPSWRKSFSPLGPCFTFIPPVDVMDISITLRPVPEVKRCKWLHENGDLYIYMPSFSNCEILKTKCNSSCGFEDYIHFSINAYDFAYVFFHNTLSFHVPVTDSLENTMRLSKRLFDGNHKLVTVNNQPNLLSKTQLVEKYQVKESCISDASYSQEECYQQKQEKSIIEKFGCSPITQQTLLEPINSTCSSPAKIKMIANLYHFKDKLCLEKCYDKFWYHDVTDVWMAKFSIFLSATSEVLKKEKEIETYPLSQLFSDAGGSLGLFLSISAFFGWKLVMSFIEKINRIISKKYQYNFHWRLLTEYTGILILSIVTSTHCLEVLKAFLSQPLQTSVYLKTHDTQKRSDIRDVIARRFASRALDCQQKEHPDDDKLAKCLLFDVLKEFDTVTPFTNLDDLPHCSEKSSAIQSHSYIVPSDVLMATTLPSRIERCYRSLKMDKINHDNSGRSRDITLHMFVDNFYYSMDLLQLMCNLGGIVGLYLGFSVIEGIDFMSDLSKKRKTWLNHKFYLNFLQFMKFLVVLSGLLLTVWLVVRFYLFRTFSSTVSTELDMSVMPLAIVVCRWPPLNIQHIVLKEDLILIRKEMLKLPVNTRLAKMVEFMEHLEENGNVSLSDLWKQASWTLSDVIRITTDESHFFFDCREIEESCKKTWEPVPTMLSQCFTMNASYYNISYSKVYVTFPEDVNRMTLWGISPQIFFTVIPYGEPPLLSEMIPRMPYERVIATIHSAQYGAVRSEAGYKAKNSASYRDCVKDCLHDTIITSYGCRLPYMERPPHIEFCNYSQYRDIPKYYKGLDKTERLAEVQNSSNARSQCHISCRHLRLMFHVLSLERFPDPYPSIEIHFKKEKPVRVMEVETQTTAQLVSDVGGIAGISVGFSLLLLLKIGAPQRLY